MVQAKVMSLSDHHYYTSAPKQPKLSHFHTNTWQKINRIKWCTWQ